MTSSNTEWWLALKRPPTTALKQIKGGRLSGMTDINPQWRYQVMTETFGPIGIGWKYTIDKLWTEQGTGEDKMAFALVSLRVRNGETWAEPIPGIGGSAMVARESGGPRSNDECYKMAVTDALSVAMKQLGVAADIYAGLWDGSKYRDSDDPPPQARPSVPAKLVTMINACNTLDELAGLWKSLSPMDRAAASAEKDRRKGELSSAEFVAEMDRHAPDQH